MKYLFKHQDFLQIRSLGYGALHCLDAHEDAEQPVKVYHCHDLGGNQYWEFKNGHLRRDDFSMQHDGSKLRLTKDNSLRKEQVSELNECKIMILTTFFDIQALEIQQRHPAAFQCFH